jgi:hypothetical protein
MLSAAVTIVKSILPVVVDALTTIGVADAVDATPGKYERESMNPAATR